MGISKNSIAWQLCVLNIQMWQCVMFGVSQRWQTEISGSGPKDDSIKITSR